MATVRPNHSDQNASHHRTLTLSRLAFLMVVPPHHFDDEPADTQPGGLLDELERRQNDVLGQLDDLDAKLSEVLKGLEPVSVPGVEAEVFDADDSDDSDSDDSTDDDSEGGISDDDSEDKLSLEDWA